MGGLRPGKDNVHNDNVDCASDDELILHDVTRQRLHAQELEVCNGSKMTKITDYLTYESESPGSDRSCPHGLSSRRGWTLWQKVSGSPLRSGGCRMLAGIRCRWDLPGLVLLAIEPRILFLAQQRMGAREERQDTQRE